MVNLDKLPTVTDYSKFLHRIVVKQNITMDQARNKYGQYTYREWESILNSKHINPRKGVQIHTYSLEYISDDQKEFLICTGFMPGKYTVKAIRYNKGIVTYESVIAVCNTKKTAKDIIEQDLKGSVYEPYTNTDYEVKSGKTVIAKLYVNKNEYIGINHPHQLRILQGMDRNKTIEKICRDCPEFAERIGLKENYYPYLFSS